MFIDRQSSLHFRFKPPQPYKYLEDVIDVSGMSMDRCPQPFAIGEIIGTEDCLKMNIYVPTLKNENMPVMVWIHGGGLTTGSNNFNEYGPLNFLGQNVLVVTINYRLGALGFLSLGNEETPGNAGMLDQILALQWIKENISAFGGDPSKVNFISIFDCQ